MTFLCTINTSETCSQHCDGAVRWRWTSSESQSFPKLCTSWAEGRRFRRVLRERVGSVRPLFRLPELRGCWLQDESGGVDDPQQGWCEGWMLWDWLIDTIMSGDCGDRRWRHSKYKTHFINTVVHFIYQHLSNTQTIIKYFPNIFKIISKIRKNKFKCDRVLKCKHKVQN